jgi:hypothetical protein
MTDEELGARVFEVFRDRLNIWTLQVSSEWSVQPNWEKAREVIDRLAVRWDMYLNELGVKRIEAHLPQRDPPAGWLKINDPFFLGKRKPRFFLLERDWAFKVVVIGLP